MLLVFIRGTFGYCITVWLLFGLNVERNLLLLASEHDMALLHRSQLWVGDGNFDYQPNGFAQFYRFTGSSRVKQKLLFTV